MALLSDWFARSSVEVARDLIGCTLVRRLDDRTEVRGEIVETEAYTADDPACHAYKRRTPRNEAMFREAGTIYVYKIYGIHHCLNLVCDRPNVANAVLIRALALDEPPPAYLDSSQPQHRLAAGPGKLCKVLDIDRRLNGATLQPGSSLWVEPRSLQSQQAIERDERAIVQTSRIGISQGVDLPWRWYLDNCPAVSKKAQRSKPS